MSRLGFFAYGAGVACVTLLTAEMTINSVIFVYRYADGITGLGSVGWLISSFGPIALSVSTWVIARKIQARWLPHLVFIPLAVLAFKEGGALYFHESGILADSMASDFALFAATGYLVLALLVHIVAFATSGISTLRRWMNDRSAPISPI